MLHDVAGTTTKKIRVTHSQLNRVCERSCWLCSKSSHSSVQITDESCVVQWQRRRCHSLFVLDHVFVQATVAGYVSRTFYDGRRLLPLWIPLRVNAEQRGGQEEEQTPPLYATPASPHSAGHVHTEETWQKGRQQVKITTAVLFNFNLWWVSHVRHPVFNEIGFSLSLFIHTSQHCN